MLQITKSPSYWVLQRGKVTYMVRRNSNDLSPTERAVEMLCEVLSTGERMLVSDKSAPPSPENCPLLSFDTFDLRTEVRPYKNPRRQFVALFKDLDGISVVGASRVNYHTWQELKKDFEMRRVGSLTWEPCVNQEEGEEE